MSGISYIILLSLISNFKDEKLLPTELWDIKNPEYVKQCYKVLNSEELSEKFSESISLFEHGCKNNLVLLNKTLCPEDMGYDEKNLVAKRIIDEYGGILCVGKVRVTITAGVPSENKEKIEVTLRRIPYYNAEIFSIKDRYIIEPVGYYLGTKRDIDIGYSLEGIVEFEVNGFHKEERNKWLENLLISANKNMVKYFDDNYKRFLEIGDEYTKREDFNAVIPNILTILVPLSKEEAKEAQIYKLNAKEFHDREGNVCGENIFTDNIVYEDWGGNLFMAGCPRFEKESIISKLSHGTSIWSICIRNDYNLEELINLEGEIFLTDNSLSCHMLGEIVFFEEMLYGSNWFRFKNIYLF